MKNRYIPAGVMLTAGLICSLNSILNQWDVIYSLIALLIVLLVFYCLGAIAEYIIRQVQEKNLQDRLAEEKRLEEERLEQERLEQERLEKEQEDEHDESDV